MFNNVFFLLVFSIIALFIYYFLWTGKKDIYICIVNSIFYFLLEPRYAFLLCFSICVTYLMVYCGFRSSKESIKRCLGIAGTVYILFVLFIYKYFSFFTNNMSRVMKLAMPIGISYYSFKMISVLIDVCIKNKKCYYSIWQYGAYVSFFPQILCGPISRIDWFGSFNNSKKINMNCITDSAQLIILGLFKKIVIAERLAIYTNVVFSNYQNYSAITLLLNAIFYSLQLYCDFSGYSDIAIAITKLFGFKCEENFMYPYFSTTVKEFWTRWHISLSKWLKDYIYIPLGGNRVGNIRRIFNIVLVFGFSGIWHGNTLNFFVWGMWHAIFNLLSPSNISKKKQKLYRLPTFLLVVLGWIFFYYTSIKDAISYIELMIRNWSFSFETIIQTIMPFTMDYSCFAHFGVICIMISLLFWEEYQKNNHKIFNCDMIRCIQLGCIILFGIVGNNSFVYANF